MVHVLAIFLLLCILFPNGGLLITLALKDEDNMNSCIAEERRALLDVKANLTDLYGNLNDWVISGDEGENTDCCKWVGVTCNNHTRRRVIQLDLGFHSSGFVGKISPSIQVLNQLQYLNLSGINFQSNPLPNILAGSLSNLQVLDISGANLSGPIPHQLTNLSNLLRLDLSRNQLEGVIPNSLGNCSSLVYLDLSQNLLNGSMPNVIGLLSNLEHLDVGHNSLNGNIPNLTGCPSLSFLDLSSNQFSGNLPSSFNHILNLRFLNLSSNQLKGILPNITSSFPGYVAMDLSNNHFEGRVPLLPFRLAALNLSKNRFSGTLSFLCEFDGFLSFLDLSNNSLSGSLPECWANRRVLKILNLSDNNLSGKIPSSLGNLSSVQALYLRTNAFVGEVPMSLGNCTHLKFLDLGGNKLSSVIPEWIGEKLPELYVLVLGSNRFYGSLPSQLCWLHNLQLLDLSNNRLSGNIPRCFDNFTTMSRSSFNDEMGYYYLSFIPTLILGNIPSSSQISDSKEDKFLDNALVTWKGTLRSFERSGLQLLKSIDLSRNNLSGTLPNEITRLIDLASLNLSTNKLQGEVPKDMGQLKSLESLDLSGNEFSGLIPSSLSQLNFLSYLNLSNNNLSGRIPSGSQLQLFTNASYNGNLQLCGPPLSPTCGSPPPPVIVVGEIDVEDDLWKSYYIGMGVGFAVGLLGICGPLTFIRSWRYFFFDFLRRMKDWIYVTVVVHINKLFRHR